MQQPACNAENLLCWLASEDLQRCRAESGDGSVSVSPNTECFHKHRFINQGVVQEHAIIEPVPVKSHHLAFSRYIVTKPAPSGRQKA